MNPETVNEALEAVIELIQNEDEGAICRGRGRMTRSANLLMPEQRQMLGVDRWFTVREIATILGVSKNTLYQAVDRGSLVAFGISGRTRDRIRVKGWRVIQWRDQIAGISDSPEEQYERLINR